LGVQDADAFFQVLLTEIRERRSDWYEVLKKLSKR
jgi:hypothetical protein